MHKPKPDHFWYFRWRGAFYAWGPVRVPTLSADRAKRIINHRFQARRGEIAEVWLAR